MFFVVVSLVIVERVGCYKPETIPCLLLVTNEKAFKLFISDELADLWTNKTTFLLFFAALIPGNFSSRYVNPSPA
jgi:hypothetical protein